MLKSGSFFENQRRLLLYESEPPDDDDDVPPAKYCFVPIAATLGRRLPIVNLETANIIRHYAII